MTIHHATAKAAEKAGFTLEEKDNGIVRAFLPKVAQQVFGVSAKDAFNQMTAFIKIIDRNPDLRLRHMEGDPITHYHLTDTTEVKYSAESNTPVGFYRDFKDVVWVEGDVDDAPQPTGDEVAAVEDTFTEDTTATTTDVTPLIKRSENGVALDGATAYAEGVMAADNPFEEGTGEADEWDAQWDQAADDAPEQREDDKTGSVVSSRYRAKYAELGHPTHCGDWLANLLNNYCIGDKETDLTTLETICGLNGISLDKYNRTTPGWQGRLRMTGRNLLARIVWKNKKIMVPDTAGQHPDQFLTIEAPADWISAQRFAKPKGE